MAKEEYAIILEYLPHGYPLEKKMMPIAQAIGEKTLVLLELVPRRGVGLKIGKKYILARVKEIKYIIFLEDYIEKNLLKVQSTN